MKFGERQQKLRERIIKIKCMKIGYNNLIDKIVKLTASKTLKECVW